jgi:flagellar export protein FliJ
MLKYTFRLETVQKLREARRNQLRAALAEAYRAEQILAERRAELGAELESLRAVQRAAAAERYLDVTRLLEVQRYELILKTREEDLRRQSDLLAIETERRRQAVIEADREVRVLELLDEKHRRQHRRKQARMEAKELDEVAINRTYHSRIGNPTVRATSAKRS